MSPLTPKSDKNATSPYNVHTFEVEGAILTLSQILITNLQGSICVHEATRGKN